MSDVSRTMEAWVANLALLVALVPLGTFLALIGALGLVGMLTGHASDLGLIALLVVLFAAGVALLAVCLSSARRETRAGPQPRKGLRIATFGVLVLGSWLLLLYALLSIR